MKAFRRDELKEYDGKDGRPGYIAYEGKVYDVSASKLWSGGLHMRRHRAGTDLTAEIQAAPHGPDLLERCPQVGVLQPEEPAAGEAPPLPRIIALLLEKNPFFRRHPHPMTVHFPIVFMMAAPFFTVLYLITGIAAFDTTAFHCLGGGVLFSVVGIATGVITWWYNYMGKMMKPIAIKLPLSIVMLVLAIVAFGWRLYNPNVLSELQGYNLLYPVIVLSLVPIVSVLGWYGATMTFPLEKD